MGAYIGQLSALVEITCPAQMTRSGGVSYVLADTVDGGRRAQLVRRLRTWKLDTSAKRPQDVAALAQIGQGALAAQPLWFVAPDAPVNNVLTPGDSALAFPPRDTFGWAAGGPRTMPDGVWAGGSFISGGSSGPALLNSLAVPVLPGVPVTASAYVAGSSARLRISLRNAAGVQVQTADGVLVSDPVTPQRVSVTATPSVTVTNAFITLEGVGTYAALPALTWTPTMYPWVDGRGCAKAVLSYAEADVSTLLAAVGTPGWGRFEQVGGIIVTEVG